MFSPDVCHSFCPQGDISGPCPFQAGVRGGYLRYQVFLGVSLVPDPFWRVGISGTRSLLGVCMSRGADGCARGVGVNPSPHGHRTWDTMGYA